MLTLRPNCENCDRDLPPNSTQACICTYECTFCRRCVDEVLYNVCPNCGGGFSARPIRPALARRPETSLDFQPASTIRVHTRLSEQDIRTFCDGVKHIDPQQR